MSITKTINFLPSVFQSDANKKFLNATLDQLVTEPNLIPINGYVGRKFAPGFTDISTYIKESTALRADYQLEPSVVVKNKETSVVELHTTYPETLQAISFYGGKTDNQDKLWSSDYYSYNPRINADAFINFGQYYWLPNGPDPVQIFAGAGDLERTFYVYPDNGQQIYNISGYGENPNPDIVLIRGGVYQFKVNQPGKNFWIQTDPGLSGLSPRTNLSTREIDGVVNNGDDNGTVTFYVPQTTAQDFYITMPLVQTVDLVTPFTYADLQGKLLSEIVATYNGFDGQKSNLNGKFLIFGTYYSSDEDWTYNSTVVPQAERYGIWSIVLTSNGAGDYVVTLAYYGPIPVNQKVTVLSGVAYGNTSWYTSAENLLVQIPVITAPLDTLYYQDGSDSGQVGIIRLVENESNSIDVDADILGRTNYVSPNGVTFTNGLKIQFDSAVTPDQYKNTEYYVEGVGSAIKLIPVSDLVINTAQGQTNYNPGDYFTAAANATLNLARDQITVQTTDFPYTSNIAIGNFPNLNNTNYVIQQDITLKYPFRASQNVPGDHTSILYRLEPVGVTLPGVILNGPANGASVPGSDNSVWNYDTNQVLINGQDQYGGQPVEDGKYVYTNGNFLSANAWANVSGFGDGYTDPDTGHSKLIGFAADGYPIYGPFGYSTPTNPQSSIIKMVSSYVAASDGLYRPPAQTVQVTTEAISTNFITVSTTYGLNPGMRVTSNDASITPESVWIIDNGLKTAQGLPEFQGTARQVQLSSNVTIAAGATLTFEFLAGAFIEDYQFDQGSGTLDQYNGRFCVTPEFPSGTYAYFITETSTGKPAYPYIVGSAFYGSTEIDTNTSLATPDYILINRASQDLNPWTRRNRWFHKSIIELTSFYNNIPQAFSSDNRAKRPIIEFDADLQLLNFGRTARAPVDIFDTQFTQPFLSVEGAQGIYVDGINLIPGMRIVFGNDEDPLTRNKIWVVNFVDITGEPPYTKTIHLTEATDGEIVEGDSVSVFNGVTNVGKSFWYDGVNWNEGQSKTSINQPPLFDVFDNLGVSFGDITKYPIINSESKFSGTKIFSYKEGTGASDPVLGFPLSYKNFNNVGDIQFTDNFDVELFTYGMDGVSYVKKINSGFLHKNNPDGTIVDVNVWTNVSSSTRQMQNISYTYDGIDNNFVVDVLPKIETVQPNFLVYVNAKQLTKADYQLFNIPENNLLVSIKQTKIKLNDRIDILVYSDSISKLGFYQIPDNLNYNAQNLTLTYPTLGELRNHIGKLGENNLNFQGSFPGVSNLRDLYISNEPGTMLQQSAPVSLATMFIDSGQYSFVDSLLNAQQEYTKFKNKFLNIASKSNQVVQSNPVSTCDYIMKQINAVKDKTFPWFYSDMIPYGDNKVTLEYTVFDPAQRNYELTTVFSNQVLSNKAILVYINNIQLIYGQEYEFLTTGPGVTILSSITLNVDDVITIVEYQNTDGNWVPETPTKLGLYPKFTPEIYTDNSYSTPQVMIRGHDGSLTPSFGDFRDNLLLELEKRIYNNIKVEYSDKLVNIYDSIPGKFRNTGYSITEYNNLISRIYLQWIGYNGLDYVTNSTYQNDSPFTYNYSNSIDITGQNLPGSWRACYEYYYDTQYPNIYPWEMLGFSEKPDWWEDTYGPAPYTSGNTILWDDLEAGYIAGGTRQGYDSKFARPGLSGFIPVNENGQLIPPIGLLTSSPNPSTFNKSWNIGQFSPTETAWRNSSEYPFAVQFAAALIRPGKYFAYGIITNKYRYNSELDQYLITGTNNRITQEDIDVNGYVNSAGVISRASGYLNWISDYQVSKGITDKSILLHYVKDYNVQLAYKMAGFSGKQYLKILAEQNSPNSNNETIIIPDSDYDLFLDKSTPVLNARYSAIIIEKTTTGFKVSGYDTAHPYITVVPPSLTGAADIIKSQSQSVNYYKEFTSFKVSVPYGTILTSLQQVANLLAGYERYLQAQGFRFDMYDETLGQIRNWQLSTKEFLFWSQQGWASGSVLVLSPAASKIKLINSIATVDAISNSFLGSKVTNQNFTILNTDNYNVVRDNNSFYLELQGNTDLIGYVELNLVQYEHVLIFNNKTQFNDVIYEPIMGQRQYRLKLVGSKTGEWSGTLSAPGFIYNAPGVAAWRTSKDYLKGDLVEYKNFYYMASKDLPGTTTFNFSDWLPVDKNKIKTGLLDNFARNAQLGESFYDVDKVNLESEFDKHALGLIGYRNRDYLNDLGLNDTSQVKFYQGFIKEKGTLNSFNALGNVTFGSQPSSVTVSEDWGFRVGSYGSLETNQFVEFVLDEAYTLSNPTSLEVLSNNAVEFSSLNIDPQGIYKTSTIPWSAPFFINRNVDSDYSEDIQTAGYVNIEDVDFTLFDLSNINTLNADISSIGAGSIIWTAKDYTQNWNVFRVNESTCKVVKLSNALNNNLEITTNKSHGLSDGDTVMVVVTDERFTGFYKVTSVTGLTTFVVSYSNSLSGFGSTAEEGPVYKLVSMKTDYPTDILDKTPVGGWRVDDKVWVNYSNSNNDWAVYNKSEPWVLSTTLSKGSLDPNSQFGTAVKLSADNNFAVASAPGYNSNVGAITNYVKNFDNRLVEDITISSTAEGVIRLGTTLDSGVSSVVAGAPESRGGIGLVFAYSRGTFGAITERQILAPNVNSAGKFGAAISVSSDDRWLYVGAPDDDKVYVYGFDDTVPVSNVTFSTDGIADTYVLPFVPVSAESILVRSSVKTYVPYLDYNLSSSSIIFADVPPVASVVITQQPGYNLVTTFEGNAGTKFGYAVAATDDGAQVVISSPLENDGSVTDSGSIMVYNRSIDNYISANGQIFGGVAAVNQYTRVYIDNILQYPTVDYTVFSLNWVLFNEPVAAGRIVTIETNVFHPIQTIYPSTPYIGQQFGYSADICSNNCSIYVGAPYQSEVNLYNGAVYRFLNQGRIYGTITGTIQNPTVTSGDSIRINNFTLQFVDTTLSSVINLINNANIPGVIARNVNGYIQIVSDSQITTNKLNILPGIGNGLADLGLTVFSEVDIINNSSTKSYDYFGKKVAVNTNSNILIVGSDLAATNENTTFDVSTAYPTTFDATSTSFVEAVAASGAVWIFGYLPDPRNTISYPGKFSFIQQLTPTTADSSLASDDGFGSDISVTDYTMLIGSMNNKTLNYNAGVVYQFADTDRLLGWDIARSKEAKVDIKSILKSYVYSADTQTIKYNLDYIDPAKGKILGLAEQDITYKIDYDPAVYNNASIDVVSINSNLYWGEQQVGQIWWDLSTVRYLDYEQGTIQYRTANWGRVFPGSSIDVYEWVESLYPPNQYVANGGSGVPKYGNNAYVTETYVDPITNFAVVKYYFWVKDKTTLTVNQFGRSIPTTVIASYIRDPRSSGVKYFAPVRDDSVSVYNLYGDPVGRDTILHIDYATKINDNIIHSEYALLSTNGKSSEIPQNIYSKLVDSASGIDIFGNPVPDPTLPVQSRYGIDIRPRQSMFIDRNQAIREFVGYANSVFANNVISQGYDLSGLEQGEPVPSVNAGVYNLVVANLEELSYVNILILPVGYKVLVQNDSSVGNLWTIYIKDRAVKSWTPNTQYLRGDVIYRNSIAYVANETFTSGETFDLTYLGIYTIQNQWVLAQVQSYKTSDYWGFVDWYAEGFDNTIKPNYTIATSGDLSGLNIKARDVIKILDNGQGQWYMIQVFPNIVNTVAIQNGTIKLSDSLYDLAAYGMGFDADNFDTVRFDQNPGIEIRQILHALRNDIFVNQLDSAFVDLFFVFVNYVLDEQKYVDWVFKTSFINVLQKIKGFNQPPIYTKENQEFYKQYIEEVKPYKSTIREYVVDYQGNDNYTGYVTDFDVPPYYDPVLKIYRSPSGEFIEDAKALTQAQYRDWLTNYPYSIESIEVINGGSGYTLPPIVTITGSTIGNNAVARALVTDGVVSKIILVYPGSNYINTPIVTINGGNGTGAIARANLKGSVVRNIKTTMVYNRYTYGTSVIEWTPNTLFTQGSIIAYNGLAYIVNQSFTSGEVFVGNYLTVYPVDKLLTANDRITAYYQPEIGQPAKDFSLLESGIGYPGVEVEGPLFSDSSGFDVAAFDMTPFDPLEYNSDGTYVISDAILDTVITGDYSDSSLGVRPEDIIVDGGPYVYDTFREWAANTYYDKGDIISYADRFWYTVDSFTSNSSFSTTNLTIYNIGPYASHAPEELIPGRVFDTLDIKVYTIATDPQSIGYTNWATGQGIIVDYIYIVDPGAGYSSSNVGVVIEGGSFVTQATAQVTLDANGSAVIFGVVNQGAAYETTPNVAVYGSNTKPIVATAVMKLSNAPASLQPYPKMAYRVLKDMNDNYTYLRIDGAATTTLANDVAINDSVIYVTDISKLPEPAASGAEPGVVFINGERITYYHKDSVTSSISQLRRGTAGTGANVHYAGNTVVDGSFNQIVFDSSNYTYTPTSNTNVTCTDGNVRTLEAGVTYIRSNLWYTTGNTTATNGDGLFVANTLQVSFLREGLTP